MGAKTLRNVTKSPRVLVTVGLAARAVGRIGRGSICVGTLEQFCLPISIECKCVEKINVWACLEQTERNAGDATPCLIFSRNRAPTYAVVPWEDLLALYARVHAGGGGDALPARVVELIQELHSHLEPRSS